MIGAISTALSGLVTASKQVERSAENISKVGTAISDPAVTTDSTLTNGDAVIAGSDVNLVEEAVNLKTAELAYKANIKVLGVAQDLTDELLESFDRKA